jgi:hypothetical protein
MEFVWDLLINVYKILESVIFKRRHFEYQRVKWRMTLRWIYGGRYGEGRKQVEVFQDCVSFWALVLAMLIFRALLRKCWGVSSEMC